MPEVFRRFAERCTGKDRRRDFSLHRFFYNGSERRKALKDQSESTNGQVRICMI
jgi:hypothetical protein